MCHECHVFRFFESGPVWGKEGNHGEAQVEAFPNYSFACELSFFCLWESVKIIVKLLCVCVYNVFAGLFCQLDFAWCCVFVCVCVFFVFLGMLFDGVRCCLILFDVVDCCWCVLFVHEFFLMFSVLLNVAEFCLMLSMDDSAFSSECSRCWSCFYSILILFWFVVCVWFSFLVHFKRFRQLKPAEGQLLL